MPERGPVGFGRRDSPREEQGTDSGSAFPTGATKLDDDIVGALIPERPARGHKGSFGKLLVIAGSLDYAGAALLVCRAAGRSGVGLVTLAIPESLQPLFAAKVVEATTMALPEDDVEEVDPEPAMARILDHEHDAIVVGPGLRPGLATTELVRSLLPIAGETDAAPLVLDAEALRSMATMDGWWTGDRRPAVLTPHAGEFARLRAGSSDQPADDGDLEGDDEARLAAAVDAATTWGSVVVLKGARTIIAAPDGSASIAPFENPALATGGTGDVLAGAIGALLAQGLEPFAAARLGVYMHGMAGDAGRERFGDAGMLASDLPDGLAVVRKRLVAATERRTATKRLGFAARDFRGGARVDPRVARAVVTTRDPGRPSLNRASPGMEPAPARPAIEQRLTEAGLPPLPRTAWLEVDLDALRGNLAVIRELAGPGVPVRPVVKADAYGHGAVPIALALEAAGADGFCVAAFDEALELREGGVRVPILVLYPVPAAWAVDAARLGVAVTVGDAAGVTEIVRAADAIDPARPLGVELEVETGLGRGGFAETQLVPAARALEAAPGIALTGLWTHFQAIEDPANTDAQVERFEAAVRALTAAGIELPPRHAAASAALMTGGVAAYDGVRPGLAIYGLVPDELEADDGHGPAARLCPVMSLIARPVRVADLPAGWGVSYGPTFRTARPSRIATLPFGYGDGWSRRLSNRASAIVRGVSVPLVGNVAMDAVMADVTDVPGAPVDSNDEFTLLGSSGNVRITADDLARERTTNTWEVVTGMARRVPRVYHAAARPVGLRTLSER